MFAQQHLHILAQVGIVVDDQHQGLGFALDDVLAFQRIAQLGLDGLGIDLQVACTNTFALGNGYARDADGEDGTCTHRLVLHFDGASVKFDETLGHSQADARSFMTRRIDLIEVFEDALDVFHIDAGTGVRDTEYYTRANLIFNC